MRQNLRKAIERQARHERVSYPEMIQRLAERVGYKKTNYRIVYAIIRGDVGTRREGMFAKVLHRTVDHLFYEEEV